MTLSTLSLLSSFRPWHAAVVLLCSSLLPTLAQASNALEVLRATTEALSAALQRNEAAALEAALSRAEATGLNSGRAVGQSKVQKIIFHKKILFFLTKQKHVAHRF